MSGDYAASDAEAAAPGAAAGFPSAADAGGGVSHGGVMIARCLSSREARVRDQCFGDSSMTRVTGQCGARRSTCSR
jgi:hypothetical protein